MHILQIGRNGAVGCFYYVMELADDATGDRGWSEDPSARSERSARAANTDSTTSRGSRFAGRLSNPEAYIPRTLAKARVQNGRLAPVTGAMRVGFEDWYHGSRAGYRDLPDDHGPRSTDYRPQTADYGPISVLNWVGKAGGYRGWRE